MATNSSGARGRLEVEDASYAIFRLDRVDGSARLPYSLKVLLENPLRNQDGTLVTAEQVAALASWDPAAESGRSTRFARQDAVEQAWRIIEPAVAGPGPPLAYQRGSLGLD